MRLKVILPLLACVLFFHVPHAEAFSRKVKSIDAGSEASGDAVVDFSRTITSPSNAALSLARSASAGVGSVERSNYCYRAVKRIIADAFGKDLKCVRTILNDGSAKNAGPELLQFGFVLDMSKCKVPGTVRVYDGRKMKGFRSTPGTWHGDVQVVGDDGMYHHFAAESRPSNESKPGRRILTGCYVPDAKKISEGPAAKCPAAYKTLKTKSVPIKSKTEQGVE